MNESTQHRIEEFLDTLRSALEGPAGRPDDIVAEMRDDLHDHIERHRSQGASEEEAVERALAELGNPYELAHHVRREVPPFGGPVLTALRFVAVGVIIVWTLVLLWYFRAWSYGAEGLAATAFVTLLHLPAVLLLWPRVVWRRNWLFGLIPAGIGLAIALFLAAAGTRSNQTLSLPLEGDPAAVIPTPQPDTPTLPAIVAFVSVGVAAVVLLLAMQQRRQRRNAILAMLLPVVLIEVPFQIEESVFRRDLAKARQGLDAGVHGFPPRTLPGSSSSAEEGINLFWSRPLCPGFSIHHSSRDGRIRVQD